MAKKTIKAWAVVSFAATLKSPKIIQDYKGKLAVDNHEKRLKNSVGKLFKWEKIIPITISYQLPKLNKKKSHDQK